MSTSGDGPCEWCRKVTKSQCGRCRISYFCDKSCTKSFWPEHKRVCKVVTEEQSRTREEYLLGLDGKQPFWLGLDRKAQKRIVEFLDVKTLWMVDCAMTGLLERRAWHKALNGTGSKAISKYPFHDSRDDFSLLSWAYRRGIALKKFKLTFIDETRSTKKELVMIKPINYFSALCAKKYWHVAELLVRTQSVNVNAVDESQDTPLLCAIHLKRTALVKTLIEIGADLDKAPTCNGMSVTPLHYASRRSVELVKLLVNGGANVNKTDDLGIPPLMMAAHEGHQEMVKVLVEGGADVTASERNGVTSLMRACAGGHVEVALLLLNSGGHIEQQDNEGLTALMWAVRAGQGPCVQFLVARGANIHHRTNLRQTSLALARASGHKAIFGFLQARGATD